MSICPNRRPCHRNRPGKFCFILLSLHHGLMTLPIHIHSHIYCTLHSFFLCHCAHTSIHKFLLWFTSELNCFSRIDDKTDNFSIKNFVFAKPPSISTTINNARRAENVAQIPQTGKRGETKGPARYVNVKQHFANSPIRIKFYNLYENILCCDF